jgi:Domain of unknown function (DUF4440)
MVYHFTFVTMKIRLIMLTAIAAAAWGQQPASVVPNPADVAQEVKALERKWGFALVQGDAKSLAEMLDDTYLDTDDEGTQTDKNGILAAVKSGDLKVTSIQLSGMRIHSFVYTAVVTGRAKQTGISKGRPLPPSVSFTDTFAMINGVWKVVASHRSAPHPK